jgi:hypothetical protein
MTHSLFRYVFRTANQALRTAFHLNPLRAFGRLAALFAVAAIAMTAWFLVSYSQGGQHLPSLLAALILTLLAGGLFVCGLLADGISSNRRLLEDVLHRLKRMDAAGADNIRSAHFSQTRRDRRSTDRDRRSTDAPSEPSLRP